MPADVPLLRRLLLRWYRSHRRALPWREQPEPYRVLVSEAMLQQTQVATVIGYFQRFMAEFPTIQALADADEQRVLRLWQGLGYYRRARHLHAAAKLIVAQHGGKVPDTVASLLQLPGVGRYTAGAVASIAFGRRAPIVDGNVARVLARWYAIAEPVDSPQVRERLWQLAGELVPARAPGDFNQALMELGATVCTPRQPCCLTCPVREQCEALGRGLVDKLPITGPRRQPKAVTHHVVAVNRNGTYLFEQRPHNGLWSNMWQLPTCEALDGEDIGAWVRERMELNVPEPVRLDQFTHQTTHRTIRFVVWRAQLPNRKTPRQSAGSQWRRLDELDDLPLANPQRRVVALLQRVSK